MINKIKSVYLEVISECNKKCSYCYNSNAFGMNYEISLELFRKICSSIIDNGINRIAISGGEPFLHTHLYDMLEYAKSNDISIHIITNLTIFNEKIYRKISEDNITLQVTFDGPNEQIHDYTRGKGSFAAIMQNLQYLSQLNCINNIDARMNLHRKNIGYIEPMLDLLSSIGIKDINLSLLNPVGSAKTFNDYIDLNDIYTISQIEYCVNELNKKSDIKIVFEGNNPSLGCPYYGEEKIECGIRIASNGGVYPCQLFTDKIFELGNVNGSDIVDIINGDRMEKFVELMHLRKDFIPECYGCAYKSMCATGCPADAYNQNGNIFTNCGKCSINKKVLQQFLINQH